MARRRPIRASPSHERGPVRRARVWAAAVGAVSSSVAYAVSRHAPQSLRDPWQRVNHAGRSVTLLEGPAEVIGLALGSSVAGVAPVVAALGAGALGALDDLVGDPSSKGLRGHLRAAREGRITTGLVKVAGLGVVGLMSAAMTDRESRPRDGATEPLPSSWVRAGDALIWGAVIAGAANLVNLFDLRPGRALKVGLVVGVPMAIMGGPRAPRGPAAAAAAAGASLGLLAPDLRGESMLGDTGANALGAVLGVALIQGRSRSTRLALLTGLVGLTLLSEKVSFTKVIESTPGLREFDAWGRPAR